MAEATTRTAYRVKVHFLETCNCDPGCNCNFKGFPDHGGCEFLVGMAVTEGHFGNVDLAGLRAVFAGKFPGALHEGHGQGILFIDGSARPEQVDGFAAILSGQMGGMPWEVLGTACPLYDAVAGPVLKPIEMTIDGRRSHFRIPGVLEARLTPLKNPVTGEEHEVHIVFPTGGLIWNDGDTATTETMQIDYEGVTLAHPGQSAVYALTEWTNQA
jgi:hypothetical protein